MKRVSGISTPLQKFGGPLHLVVILLIVLHGFGYAPLWLVPLALLAGVLLFCWGRRLADGVYDNEVELVVRFRGIETAIPFDQISTVEEAIWSRPRTVRVGFRQQQQIGGALIFIPAFDPSMIFPPGESQVARDLRWRSGLAKYR